VNIFDFIAEGMFSRLYEFLRGKTERRGVEVVDKLPAPSQTASIGIKKYIHQLRLEATLESISISHKSVHGALGSELADCVKHRNIELMFEMADRLERQMMYATKVS